MPHTLTVPDELVTACYDEDPEIRRGLTATFSSKDLIDHMEAAALCELCPFLEGCRQLAHDIAASPEAAWSRIPEGTWGGELWRSGKRVTTR